MNQDDFDGDTTDGGSGDNELRWDNEKYDLRWNDQHGLVWEDADGMLWARPRAVDNLLLDDDALQSVSDALSFLTLFTDSSLLPITLDTNNKVLRIREVNPLERALTHYTTWRNQPHDADIWQRWQANVNRRLNDKRDEGE